MLILPEMVLLLAMRKHNYTLVSQLVMIRIWERHRGITVKLICEMGLLEDVVWVAYHTRTCAHGLDEAQVHPSSQSQLPFHMRKKIIKNELIIRISSWKNISILINVL